MFAELLYSLKKNLRLIDGHHLLIRDVNIGLERETLRINKNDGKLSTRPHPTKLGSALTHPNITTDFAEMMLEFVTDPYDSAEEALAALSEIQTFALSQLDDEIFWPNSMPPAITSEDDIIIAEYGDSNNGKMKHLYRKGLSLRYGKMMQAISGIHYNFSFKNPLFEAFSHALNYQGNLATFKTQRYLNLSRNIMRFGYIIPYFLGASPIMCKSFFKNHPNKFSEFNSDDSYLDQGTSLRLSDIGYGNNKCHFDISLNDIDTFIHNIHYAISTPCTDFSKIPVKINDEYQQISNCILQIENEYYASIRPKQIMDNGQNFLEALKNKGIEYVELRSIDVNPLFQEGIDVKTMKFLQALLSTCLLTDAPFLSQIEYEQSQSNLKLVAEKGYQTDLKLSVMQNELTLKEALQFVLDWMEPICNILGEDYIKILEEKKRAISNPSLTPSAQIINDLKKSGLNYHHYFLAKAQDLYIDSFRPLENNRQEDFKKKAKNSIMAQKEIEIQKQAPFEQYLDNYFNMNI